eukprot:COSAG02_NODE_790_length_17186_cov_791.824603_4_plen_58_part_00
MVHCNPRGTALCRPRCRYTCPLLLLVCERWVVGRSLSVVSSGVRGCWRGQGEGGCVM